MQREVLLETLYMVNKGYTLLEVASRLGVSPSKLSKTITNLVKKGVVSRHVLVPLSPSGLQASIAILRHYQKSNLECLPKYFKVIAKYYSFKGSLVEIYVLGEKPEVIKEHVDSSLCALDLCDVVKGTLLPLLTSDSRIVFEAFQITGSELDSIDYVVLQEVFRLFNPPLSYEVAQTKTLLLLLQSRTGLRKLRWHFYKHVYKFLRKRLALRMNNDFLILAVYAPSLSRVQMLLEVLVGTGLLSDAWQLLVLSEAPLVGLLFAWGNFERFLDLSTTHEVVNNIAYEVYPVLGVAY